MSQKIGTIVKIEGVLLLILAASMLPSLLIAVSKNETTSINAFVVTACLCSMVGLFICLRLSNLQRQKLKGRDGFFIVALSWIIASLVGAVPFWLSGSVPTFFDAFFESVSGFSTTGASIFTDVETLPTSILFWRSLTSWLGGMGIIMLMSALFPALGIDGQITANVEIAGPTKSKLSAKFSDGAKEIYSIYVIMTLVETLLLKLRGLTWFDSLIHTFGTVSTGGFSSYNDNIGHFNSVYVEIIVAIFMLLAALNLTLYFTIPKNGLSRLLRDEETRFYTTLIIVAAGSVALYNTVMTEFLDFGHSILNSFFQVISIITTTGYNTDNYDLWPTFSRIIIFALFFIGGCSSSTGGGIKSIRILVAYKMVRRSISLKIHPNRIAPVTLDGKEMSNDTLIKISNFVFTYILLLMIGFMLISLNGFDFMTNLSASASCLGNIGPGFSGIGPNMDFAMFSNFSKLVCSFLMITGRLELYTILMLLSRYYWNPNKVK